MLALIKFQVNKQYIQFLLPYLENKHGPPSRIQIAILLLHQIAVLLPYNYYTTIKFDKTYSSKIAEEKLNKNYGIRKILKEVIENEIKNTDAIRKDEVHDLKFENLHLLQKF